jgi:hypothetical protein
MTPHDVSASIFKCMLSLQEEGAQVCSHVEDLADRLFLFARRVRVAEEERVERLELVARHAASGAGRLSVSHQHDRAARFGTAATGRKRRGIGMTRALKDKRGGWVGRRW